MQSKSTKEERGGPCKAWIIVHVSSVQWSARFVYVVLLTPFHPSPNHCSQSVHSPWSTALTLPSTPLLPRSTQRSGHHRLLSWKRNRTQTTKSAAKSTFAEDGSFVWFPYSRLRDEGRLPSLLNLATKKGRLQCYAVFPNSCNYSWACNQIFFSLKRYGSEANESTQCRMAHVPRLYVNIELARAFWRDLES